MDTLEGPKVKDLVVYDLEKAPPLETISSSRLTNERQATAAIND